MSVPKYLAYTLIAQVIYRISNRYYFKNGSSNQTQLVPLFGKFEVISFKEIAKLAVISGCGSCMESEESLKMQMLEGLEQFDQMARIFYNILAFTIFTEMKI